MKNVFLSSDQNFLKKEEYLDYDSWIDIFSYENAENENIFEKDYFKELIFTADPFLDIYKDQQNQLKYLDQSSFYKITYDSNDIFTFFESFYQIKEELNILSAFQTDPNSNFIIIETGRNNQFKSKFLKGSVEELSPSFIIQNFCNPNRFLPLKIKNRMFARIVTPEYKNQPIEIFDVDFKQKKAIIRLLPVLEVPKFSTSKPEAEAYGISVLELSYLHTKKERFKVSFDGKKTIDGYRFRDTKYSSNFIITKTKIENILTWSSNLTENELKIFKHARKIHDKDHPKYRPSYVIDDDDLYDSYSLDEDEKPSVDVIPLQYEEISPKSVIQNQQTTQPINHQQIKPQPLVNYKPNTPQQTITSKPDSQKTITNNVNEKQQTTKIPNTDILNKNKTDTKLAETINTNKRDNIQTNSKTPNQENLTQQKASLFTKINEIIEKLFVNIDPFKIKPPKTFYNTDQKNKWKDEIEKRKTILESKVKKYREAITLLRNLSNEYPKENPTLNYFINRANSSIDMLHKQQEELSMIELQTGNSQDIAFESPKKAPIKTGKVVFISSDDMADVDESDASESSGSDATFKPPVEPVAPKKRGRKPRSHSQNAPEPVPLQETAVNKPQSQKMQSVVNMSQLNPVVPHNKPTQLAARPIEHYFSMHQTQGANQSKELMEKYTKLSKESQEQKDKIKSLELENQKLKQQIAEHQQKAKAEKDFQKGILELQTNEGDFSSLKQIKVTSSVVNMVGRVVEKRGPKSFLVRALPQFIEIPAGIVSPASFPPKFIPMQYDLVRVNQSAEFGIVIHVDSSTIHFLNYSNIPKVFSIDTSLQKLKSDNTTTDMNGNRLYIGDHVIVASNSSQFPNGVLGEVLQVYQGIIFTQILSKSGTTNVALRSNQVLEVSENS